MKNGRLAFLAEKNVCGGEVYGQKNRENHCVKLKAARS